MVVAEVRRSSVRKKFGQYGPGLLAQEAGLPPETILGSDTLFC